MQDNQSPAGDLEAPLTQIPSRARDRRRIHIKQVDAFTDVPLTGNPAGVVVDAASLSDQEMQTVAREIAASETAFILPPTVRNADLRIRWFTPTTEVPLCGHATVAAFHALAEESLYGMLHDGTYRFSLETRSGLLPVVVEKAPPAVEVWMGVNLPSFTRANTQKLDVMRILNIGLDDFESRLPIVVDAYMYVPIRRLHTIFAMQPNFFAVSQFLRNRGVSGLCVFTTETVDRSSHVHSRFFAPTIGIPEDPVTGSANGPLAAYLFEHGMLEQNGPGSRTRRPAGGETQPSPDRTLTVVCEQGDVIGRKGRVKVELTVAGDTLASVRIAGRAVTVFDGEMLIA